MKFVIDFQITQSHSETIDTEANDNFWADQISSAGFDPTDPDDIGDYFESMRGRDWLFELASDANWVDTVEGEVTEVQPESGAS